MFSALHLKCGVFSTRAMAKYRYGYDQNGNLVKSLDILNKTEYNYYYKGEKLSRMTESSVELQTVDGYTTEVRVTIWNWLKIAMKSLTA